MGKYQTRQEIITDESHPKGRDYIIGLDLGYNTTKIYYESGHICFPSYVKLITSGYKLLDEKDILYRDAETGKIYIVGYNAREMVGSDVLNDTYRDLYSRKRYADIRFQIICNTAIALTCYNKQREDERKIFIQTGIPGMYLDKDEKIIKQVISNNTPFSLKVGSGPWIDFQFNITDDDISVILQPWSSLVSCVTKNDGTFATSFNTKELPDARNIRLGNVFILDADYKTFDFCGISAGKIVLKKTVNNISMRAVYELAGYQSFKNINGDIRISLIQQCAESGKITWSADDIFSYMEDASQKILEHAKKNILRITNFGGYEYLIIDGWAGGVWYPEIKHWLSDRPMSVFLSNSYSFLDMIYSHSRGYYMYRYLHNCYNREI